MKLAGPRFGRACHRRRFAGDPRFGRSDSGWRRHGWRHRFRSGSDGHRPWWRHRFRSGSNGRRPRSGHRPRSGSDRRRPWWRHRFQSGSNGRRPGSCRGRRLCNPDCRCNLWRGDGGSTLGCSGLRLWSRSSLGLSNRHRDGRLPHRCLLRGGRWLAPRASLRHALTRRYRLGGALAGGGLRGALARSGLRRCLARGCHLSRLRRRASRLGRGAARRLGGAGAARRPLGCRRSRPGLRLGGLCPGGGCLCRFARCRLCSLARLHGAARLRRCFPWHARLPGS